MSIGSVQRIKKDELVEGGESSPFSTPTKQGGAILSLISRFFFGISLIWQTVINFYTKEKDVHLY